MISLYNLNEEGADNNVTTKIPTILADTNMYHRIPMARPARVSAAYLTR